MKGKIMIQHKDHFHGSDLEKIEKIYGIKKDEIVSFSANVNPLGVSQKLRQELSAHIDAITSYPDREYTSLRKCMAAYCGCDYEHILVGNGSTELISLLIQIRHPKHAMIVGPTYSEYEREIALEGGITHYYPLKESDDFRLDESDFLTKLDEHTDFLILCNPNNPTSTCIKKDSMRRILDRCKMYGIFVMIDETYVEFAPDIAKVSAVSLANDYNNLAILRGTSKFFAAPGLRLGYAVLGDLTLLNQINSMKNPWTINSLAVVAGETMFQDTGYIKATRDLILSERDRMYTLFSESSRFKAYKPYGNFMLLRILDPSLTSGQLFDRAIREKMMIRDCSTFPFLDDHYIRFCFMKPEDNDRLAECLLRP